MIPYFEIRDKKTKLQKALIVPVDCFGELSYYGVGAFLIKCRLDDNVRRSVSLGDFATIPNKPYIYVIESLSPSYSTEEGYTMTIQGRQAKCLLSQRVIYKPKLLSTNLVEAVQGLVEDNAGARAGSTRNMDIVVEPSAVAETINETQATVGDLLAFTDSLLQTKECGAEVFVENNTLKYRIYKGIDRSSSIIFSQSFDNLLNCGYIETDTIAKNCVLLESEDIFQEYNADPTATGIDRKEVFIESGVSPKYTNAQGVEVELNLTNATDLAIFKKLLVEDGKEQLTNHKVEKTFSGDVDTSLNQYEFGVDFYLGDKVGVRDGYLNISTTPRVTKWTFSQNATAYAEKIDYEN